MKRRSLLETLEEKVALLPCPEVAMRVIEIGGSPALSDTATITIDLNDVNETPVVDDRAFTLDENSAGGTVVGSVAASDPDTANTLSYTITGGNTDSAFAIDGSTGQLTVNNVAALDFETNPSFSLTIEVTDDGTPGLSDTATVTINLSDPTDDPADGVPPAGSDDPPDSDYPTRNDAPDNDGVAVRARSSATKDALTWDDSPPNEAVTFNIDAYFADRRAGDEVGAPDRSAWLAGAAKTHTDAAIVALALDMGGACTGDEAVVHHSSSASSLPTASAPEAGEPRPTDRPDGGEGATGPQDGPAGAIQTREIPVTVPPVPIQDNGPVSGDTIELPTFSGTEAAPISVSASNPGNTAARVLWQHMDTAKQQVISDAKQQASTEELVIYSLA